MDSDQIALRRSGRQKSRISVVTSESDVRDYSLNLKKALEKKAENCLTDIKINHEVKDGGNHIYTMSTAVYEVYKCNSLNFFEKKCNHGVPKIKHIHDQSGLNVETQVKVYSKYSSKYTEQLKYCISFFHTKCKLLVNGKAVHEFKKDHKEIVKMVLSCRNLNDIDKEVYQQICSALNNMSLASEGRKKRVRYSSSIPAQKTVPKTKTSHDSLHIDNNVGQLSIKDSVSTDDTSDTQITVLEHDNPQAQICMHCDNVVETLAIECTTCSTWYHYQCENLSHEFFERHTEDPAAVYECMSCSLNNSVNCDAMTTPTNPREPHMQEHVNLATSLVPDLTIPSSQMGNMYSNSTNSSTCISSPAILESPTVPTPSTVASAPYMPPPPCISAVGVTAVDVSHCVSKPISAPTVTSHDTYTNLTCMNEVPLATDDTETSLKEQMLNSKQKTLSNKEKRLKELKKKLNNKEISLSDQIDQNNFSKAYIVSMENKIKELESSNRLLKLKLLSVPDQNDKQTPSEPNETHVSPVSYFQPSQSNGGDLAVSMRHLQNRVLSLEVKLLEQRLNSLETPQQGGGFGGHYWQNGQGYGPGSPYSPVYAHMSHSWLGNYPNTCSQQNAWSLPYSGCHVPSNNYYNWPDETPVYTSGNYYTHSVPSRDDTSPGTSDSHSYTLHPNVKHGSHTDIENPTVHHVVHQCSNNAETGGTIDSAPTIGRQIPVHFSHRGRRPNVRR